MRLKFETPEVETTEPLASQQMGIREQDMHIVLDLLRNKLYKDPIRACVREYLCNARDAHREVGTPDKPVRVTLPTELARQIEFKDEGPGISPRRMGDIFLNYGASTKRRDNSQTGGFGLGSKSGLAVSDAISVVSIYNGVKRHYRVYIDETKIGRCDLVSEEQTQDHSGTTIIIPVKAGDETKFAQAVVAATRFWTVRPEVLNMPASVSFPENQEPVLSEPESWSLSSLVSVEWGSNDKVFAIVDGIPYPVTTQDLSITSSNDDWRYNFMQKRVNLYFKTGQISLVPSRDSIQFDEHTVKAITRKLEQVRGAVFDNALAKLASKATLLEAEMFWTEFQSLMPGAFKKEYKAEWNGIQLRGLTIHRQANEPTFTARLYSLKPKRGDRHSLVLTSEGIERLHVHPDARIFWNDTDSSRGFSRRVEHYLRAEREANSGKNIKVCIVSFPNITSQMFWLGERNLIKLGAQPASTIPAIPRAPRGSRPQMEKREDISCWKFNSSHRGEKDSDKYWEPVDMDKNVDEECIYIQSVNKAQGDIECGDFPHGLLPTGGYGTVENAELLLKVLYPDSYVRGLAGGHNHTLYLVPRRLEGQLGPNWKRLDHVFPSRVAKVLQKVAPAEIKRASEAGPHLANEVFDRHTYTVLKDAVADGSLNNALIVSFIGESKAARREFAELNELNEISERFSHRFGPKDGAAVQLAQQTLPPHPIILKHTEVKRRYPLLFHCSAYATKQELLDYIKAMDILCQQNTQPSTQVVASAQIDDEPDNYCVAV